jgi:hypothetical protein
MLVWVPSNEILELEMNVQSWQHCNVGMARTIKQQQDLLDLSD